MKKFLLFFKEMFHRFLLPSPTFFRQLQRFGVWLSGISLLQMGIKEKMPDFTFPHFLNAFFNYSSAIGLAIVFISKLTVSSMDDLEKKMNSEK